MAPVEALSSAGEEGGGGQAEGWPVLAWKEHWRQWAPLPAGCGPDGSCAAAANREAGGYPHLPSQRWPPSPARPAPTSICQQVLSSVHQLPSCPLRTGIPRSSRETVLNPSGFVDFIGGRVTPWDVCGGRKAGSWGHSFIHQKPLSSSSVLGIVLGPRETLGNKTGFFALQELTPHQERSNS